MSLSVEECDRLPSIGVTIKKEDCVKINRFYLNRVWKEELGEAV